MIKIIAAFFMLLDHLVLIFPEYSFLRLIGRFSMPMFAFVLARGLDYYLSIPDTFVKRKKVQEFLLHIIVFALISQIPYSFMSENTLNIGFTWLFASLLIFAIYFLKYLKIVAVIGVILSSFVFPFDYGIYGVVYPAMFYFCIFKHHNYSAAFLCSIFLFPLAFVSLGEAASVQIMSVFAVWLIWLLMITKWENLIRLPKYFFYVFYPAHIAVFVIIKRIFF